MDTDDWRAKPASEQLVALAFGGAARIAVRYGLTTDQAAKLMRSAWSIVQDELGESDHGEQKD